MQNENAIVYLLKSKHDQMFKIGKSINLTQRLSALQKDYEFDLENSWTLKIPQKEVFKLENLLHFSFEKARIDNLPKAKGYTEFFNVSSFNDVLMFVDMISKYKSINISKGIHCFKNNSMSLKGEAWKKYLEVRKNQRILESQKILERFFRFIELAYCHKKIVFTQEVDTIKISFFSKEEKLHSNRFKKYNTKLEKNKGYLCFSPFSDYMFDFNTSHVIYKIDINVLFNNEIKQNYECIYKKYLEKLPWR